MTSDIDLITDHVGPAAIQHWQDVIDSDDRRAVKNFQTYLQYGPVLAAGTFIDYVKDAHAVRVNGEDDEEQPNWSTVSKHIAAMVDGDVSRTCDRCDQPAYSTNDGKLCEEHFLEKMGPAWRQHVRETTKGGSE